MSSLDEVFEQMRLFERTLFEFNEEVRASAAALSKSHDELCGLWRDEASLRYRAVYEPMAASLDQYLRADAPRFEEFLKSKIVHLERYLHGAS
jgi:hypothetical protein